MKSTNKVVQMALNSVACNGGQSKDKLLAIYKRELNKPGDKVEFKKVEKLAGGFETWYIELFAKWHDEDREDPFNRLERAINAGERVLYTAVEVRRKIANDGSVAANVQVSVRNVGNSVAANRVDWNTAPYEKKYIALQNAMFLAQMGDKPATEKDVLAAGMKAAKVCGLGEADVKKAFAELKAKGRLKFVAKNAAGRVMDPAMWQSGAASMIRNTFAKDAGIRVTKVDALGKSGTDGEGHDIYRFDVKGTISGKYKDKADALRASFGLFGSSNPYLRGGGMTWWDLKLSNHPGGLFVVELAKTDSAAQNSVAANSYDRFGFIRQASQIAKSIMPKCRKLELDQNAAFKACKTAEEKNAWSQEKADFAKFMDALELCASWA